MKNHAKDSLITMTRGNLARNERNITDSEPGKTAITPTRERDRDSIESILRRTPAFKEAEVKVALEVLDVYLYQKGQKDYIVYSASRGGSTLGFICFGLNPMTDGTFELYWIAVDPNHYREGAGKILMAVAEYEAARLGGRLIVVETSSAPEYQPTRTFYRRLGYLKSATVKDYYSAGDSKIILVKKLRRLASD